jgi:hypothetical protein
VTEKAANEILTDRALEKIRKSAKDGSLIKHSDLLFILYRWREFVDGDPREVRAWTDSLMHDDTALVVLARRMTGTSWSAGMGSSDVPGDRVAKGSTSAVVPENSDLLDLDTYRAA